MTGFDKKTLTLTHSAPESVLFRLEVDITGSGHWHTYRTFSVAAGQTKTIEFPRPFQAYWARVTGDRETSATAWFVYQ